MATAMIWINEEVKACIVSVPGQSPDEFQRLVEKIKDLILEDIEYSTRRKASARIQFIRERKKKDET